jgi:hypothetical protein
VAAGSPAWCSPPGRHPRPPIKRSGCTTDDFADLIGQLDGVARTEHDRYIKFAVSGRTLGYLWARTGTVGLRQTLDEQRALVAERPDVFEVQFTTATFGWVVVRLSGVQRDELAELAFEAWRLSASQALVTARAERLPS